MLGPMSNPSVFEFTKPAVASENGIGFTGCTGLGKIAGFTGRGIGLLG
jgi:hypothetical protein